MEKATQLQQEILDREQTGLAEILFLERARNSVSIASSRIFVRDSGFANGVPQLEEYVADASW